MKSKLSQFLFYILSTVLLITTLQLKADDREDSSNGSNICVKSAKNMFRSCRHEVKEEFFATTAKCINIEDSNSREQCLVNAQITRQEDKQNCGEQKESRKEVCELLGEDRFSEALLNSGNFVGEPDNSNPYFSLQPGHTYVARAGENFEEIIVVTVTDHIREILGVNCRVVVDIVLVEEDGEFVAIEVTDDFYAQAINSDIHYCGEIARNYEDGLLVDLDGSFQAGRDLANSGILIKASPNSGNAHRQEYLLGEAEDVIQYIAGVANTTSVGFGEGGENPAFFCDGNCVKTEEFIPPEPESGEYKYFLADTGFVLGVALENGVPTGERDEVLCVGGSLDVLHDPSCGIENPAELLEQLCELSPIAFCD